MDRLINEIAPELMGFKVELTLKMLLKRVNMQAPNMCVEQEKCYGENPFACLEKSYKYLTSLGLK